MYGHTDNRIHVLLFYKAVVVCWSKNRPHSWFDWRRNTLEERGRDFEGMVKRWKRNSQTVVAEFKRRKYYTPPSEQRRLAKAKAEKRARRAQMKRERMERRNG